MNIAIILGVSEYIDSANNLPGCQTDVDYINHVVRGINKFDEILVLNEKTNSNDIKNQLTNFLSKFEDKQLGELFFYYTGHGEFFNNEFYYILSDFDKKKRKQTSLENNELDNLFRSVNPELLIKVVDACQAGVTYVKGGDSSFEKYLNETGSRFNKCYFMFSSQSEQYSYQDEVSHFTKSFVNAVISHKSENIRYKDIIDYISDEFENNSEQTPFFVTQANFTEKFAFIDQEMRNTLLSIFNSDSKDKKKDTEKSVVSFEEFVMNEANEFCTEVDVLKIMGEIKEQIEKYSFPTNFTNIYDVEIHPFKTLENKRLTEPNVPKLNLIGKWLKDNKHDYFAKPNINVETYIEEQEEPSFATALFNFGLNKSEKKKNVTKTREIITGYSTTYEYPYKAIRIIAKPKYENLQWYNCSLLFITSKNNIRLFYFCSNYDESNWSNRSINNNFDWKTVEVKLKDNQKISETLNKILSEYTYYILAPLVERYNSSVMQTKTEDKGNETAKTESKKDETNKTVGNKTEGNKTESKKSESQKDLELKVSQ
ncbi:caspase family protein [Cohnella yongneupensis]|uniref:Caspase family protein n=1 Tax=Cohnella yongneupensis TaxID=425006 RepID=A0ABW0QU24_9BACL